MTRKTAAECLEAFKSILNEAKVVPRFVFVDLGGEFGGSFKEYCVKHGITVYSTTTSMKSFPSEQFNYALKSQIERMLTFQRNRAWTSVLQRACSIYNQTESKALMGLSPNMASMPKNVARLQMYYLKKKSKHAESFTKKEPLKVGQAVKVVYRDPFRQRGFKRRWSDKTYHIAKVLNNAVPTGYYVTSFGSRLFYSQELNPVAEESHMADSIKSRKILGIISDKQIPIRWLRSGKPLELIRKFLVQTNEQEGNHFLTEAEILTFDNGSEKLKDYRERLK